MVQTTSLPAGMEARRYKVLDSFLFYSYIVLVE